jgi:hypothetical protein
LLSTWSISSGDYMRIISIWNHIPTPQLVSLGYLLEPTVLVHEIIHMHEMMNKAFLWCLFALSLTLVKPEISLSNIAAISVLTYIISQIDD